jgi:hypothetical protein
MQVTRGSEEERPLRSYEKLRRDSGAGYYQQLQLRIAHMSWLFDNPTGDPAASEHQTSDLDAFIKKNLQSQGSFIESVEIRSLMSHVHFVGSR